MTVIVDGRQGIILALPLRERDGAARDAKDVAERLNESAVPTTTTTYHMLKLNSTNQQRLPHGTRRLHPQGARPCIRERPCIKRLARPLLLTEVAGAIQSEYGPYKY